MLLRAARGVVPRPLGIRSNRFVVHSRRTTKMRLKPWTFQAVRLAVILSLLQSTVSQAQPSPHLETLVESALSRIKAHIAALLSKPQPELFSRHLRSVLALSEENVLKLQLAGADKDEREKQIFGYLSTIEAGLNIDGERAEPYLVDGRRSLTLARLSQSDGTLQFCIVSMPPHWDSRRAYALHIQLHGRGPDVPLAYVSDTFQPPKEDPVKNADVITIVPWLRGNGEWRNENGSEPDIWEAIEDVKSFATVDPNRWYLSGHSWGGDDAWSIVQRTPDLWAAVGIMAGNPVGAPYALGLVGNASNGLVAGAHPTSARTFLVYRGHAAASRHLGDFYSKSLSRCVSTGGATCKVRMLDSGDHHSHPRLGRQTDRSEFQPRRFEPVWERGGNRKREESVPRRRTFEAAFIELVALSEAAGVFIRERYLDLG